MSFQRLAIVLAIVSVICTSIGFIGDMVRDRARECPPFDQCTGSPATNHPRCKCWDSK